MRPHHPLVWRGPSLLRIEQHRTCWMTMSPRCQISASRGYSRQLEPRRFPGRAPAAWPRCCFERYRVPDAPHVWWLLRYLSVRRTVRARETAAAKPSGHHSLPQPPMWRAMPPLQARLRPTPASQQDMIPLWAYGQSSQALRRCWVAGAGSEKPAAPEKRRKLLAPQTIEETDPPASPWRSPQQMEPPPARLPHSRQFPDSTLPPARNWRLNLLLL